MTGRGQAYLHITRQRVKRTLHGVGGVALCTQVCIGSWIDTKTRTAEELAGAQCFLTRGRWRFLFLFFTGKEGEETSRVHHSRWKNSSRPHVPRRRRRTNCLFSPDSTSPSLGFARASGKLKLRKRNDDAPMSGDGLVRHRSRRGDPRRNHDGKQDEQPHAASCMSRTSHKHDPCHSESVYTRVHTHAHAHSQVKSRARPNVTK